MIQELPNKKGTPAITSDRWHVVHARWSGNPAGHPRFERSIVSEHEDRVGAASASQAITSAFTTEMSLREPGRRDQVFVRRPNYKSLKLARRRESKD